jgi:hypothetical protein
MQTARRRADRIPVIDRNGLPVVSGIREIKLSDETAQRLIDGRFLEKVGKHRVIALKLTAGTTGDGLMVELNKHSAQDREFGDSHTTIRIGPTFLHRWGVEHHPWNDQCDKGVTV